MGKKLLWPFIGLVLFMLAIFFFLAFSIDPKKLDNSMLIYGHEVKYDVNYIMITEGIWSNSFWYDLKSYFSLIAWDFS